MHLIKKKIDHFTAIRLDYLLPTEFFIVWIHIRTSLTYSKTHRAAFTEQKKNCMRIVGKRWTERARASNTSSIRGEEYTHTQTNERTHYHLLTYSFTHSLSRSARHISNAPNLIYEHRYELHTYWNALISHKTLDANVSIIFVREFFLFLSFLAFSSPKLGESSLARRNERDRDLATATMRANQAKTDFIV